MTNLPNPRFITGWTDGGELATATFKQSGSSASSVDLFARFAKTFYPSDYGAIGDSVSHPLSARFVNLAAAQAVYPFATSLSQELDYCGLQACVNAAGAARGAVDMTGASGYIFHASLDTLQLNNTNCPNGLLLRGAGRAPTAIIKNNSSTDTILVTGTGFYLQDFLIIDFLTATAGCAINATGSQHSNFERLRIEGTYSGLDFSGVSAIWANRCYVRGMGVNGFAARLGGTASSFCDSTLGQTAPKLHTGVGILVTNADSWICSDIESEGYDKALSFRPTGGQFAVSNRFISCFFDSSNYGAISEPGTGSEVQRSVFVACWFGDCLVDGFRASSANGGFTNGAMFLGCELVNNAVTGARVDAASGTKGLFWEACQFAQNATGLDIGAGISNWGVGRSKFGPFDAFAANNSNIIVRAGASDWYEIVGNMMVPPVGTNLSDGGTGTNVMVKNNLGYNPVGGSAITVGASPYTYTAGHSDETIYILGGTVSIIATGGGTVATASPATVQLGPNETVTVTYSVAPTMRKSIH